MGLEGVIAFLLGMRCSASFDRVCGNQGKNTDRLLRCSFSVLHEFVRQVCEEGLGFRVQDGFVRLTD